jgi:hypothetical protein
MLRRGSVDINERRPVVMTSLTDKLEAAAEFLQDDLTDTADVLDIRGIGDESTQEWLLALADSVGEIPDELLEEYAKALEVERGLFPDGPDFIHCSMTMEIGAALHPRDVEDLCRIYIRAVQLARHDPLFAETDMAVFWSWFGQGKRH